MSLLPMSERTASQRAVPESRSLREAAGDSHLDAFRLSGSYVYRSASAEEADASSVSGALPASSVFQGDRPRRASSVYMKSARKGLTAHNAVRAQMDEKRKTEKKDGNGDKGREREKAKANFIFSACLVLLISGGRASYSGRDGYMGMT
ncbi:hypothetical protein MRX96_041033 [Rhipicephalus microplus]